MLRVHAIFHVIQAGDVFPEWFVGGELAASKSYINLPARH
jgi:hypothetical protein